jgi:hypothetical protein
VTISTSGIRRNLPRLPTLDRNETLGNWVYTKEESFKRDGPDARRRSFVAENDVRWTLIAVDLDEHVTYLLFVAPTVRKTEAYGTLGTYSESS